MLDLAGEAVRAERGGELGAEHLDRDLAIVLQVLGEVDGGHAALAELALDPVGGAEGRWSWSRGSVDVVSRRGGGTGESSGDRDCGSGRRVPILERGAEGSEPGQGKALPGGRGDSVDGTPPGR